MADEVQDVDSLFPAKPADVDTLFPAEVENNRKRQSLGASPIQDLIFGNADVSPVARILDHFGQGFKHAWGSEPLGLSPESSDYLKKSGMFNDYVNGHTSVTKAFNEALIRPSAVALDAGMRTATGLFTGAQETVAGTGADIGQPKLGKELAAIPEAFMGSPHPLGIPEVNLPKARALGVIGVGEEGWKGTAEVPHVAEAEAAKVEMPAAEAPVTGRPVEPAPQLGQPAAEAPPPDVHAVARSIDPETFTKYDALQTRQQTFRRWIDELRETRDSQAEANAPHVQEIQDTIAKINDPDTTPRLRKKYQTRLDDMSEDYNKFMDDATAKDSADMSSIRKKLQETDYAMRDLAPNVGKAYQVAREKMPPGPVVEPAPIAEPKPEVAQEVVPQEATQEPPTAIPEIKPPETETPSLAPVKPIVDDVADKLTAAGRPADEAQAAAQIVSAYWQTRAARFKGAKGTAEELYNAESPDIAAPKATPLPDRAGAMAFAQTKRGRIRLREDGRNTISLMKDANASTFIHETGHDWLDRMMKDAVDEAAPLDLKADADAVKKWLGVDGDIKTSQHEKFARGFERYLMEGTAPSQELAGVFAKFKAWLTQIYQTVTRLKAPITDDIRDVFDRLLSTNPEKVVVAPEREIPKNFADHHEALAEAATPEKAHETAETIQTERDRLAAKHIPEDQDARLEGIAAEASRREPGSAEPNRTGDEAQSLVRESRDNAALGTLGEGGSEIAQKGAGPRAEVEPETPHSPFPPSDDGLVDKAGNIRLENLNTPQDINQVIRDTAKDNGDFMDVRGPVSDAEVLSMAEAMGMDAAYLDARKMGEAWTAPQIVALRQLLIKSATSVRDAMAKAAEGTDADVMAYAEAKARHQMIQERVSSVTAEAGRALRAFQSKFTEGMADAKQIGEFLKDATGKTLYQLKEEAQFGSKLKTPQQVSKFVNDSEKSGFKKAILEYYINALISGPVTHARYSVGNAINALFTPLVEVPFAAGVGKIREAMGREGERVYLGESGAQLYGMLKGSRDGLSAAIEAFKSGVSPLLPGEKVSPHFMEPQKAIPGPIGAAIRIPGKSVAAIHSFFKSLRYEQNLQALAYRTAVTEGLEGEALNARIADLTTNPPETMMTSATGDALKELFMAPTEYHSAMGSLTRFTNKSLLAKIVVPFMKIGSQITRNAFVERTPLGAFSSSVRETLGGEKGGAASDVQSGKMVAGMALMGTTVLMAAEGMATGDGPEEPAKRAVWLLNHTPNSITVGDITIPYQGLGHLGMLMRFSADMYETAHGWEGDDGSKLAVAFFEGITKSVLDENFMRGAKDMLDAVYHPQEYGGRYIKSMVTNWLPYSVGMSQVARKIDPYQRETRGIFEAAQAKVPWASESLMPRRDIFGEPIPNGGPNPSYADDPVVKAMNDLKIGVGRLEKKIRGVELSEQQYDDYARVSGRMAKLRLNALVSNPGFATMPATMRVELIHNAISTSRESARSMVMMQNPEIITKAVDAKTAKVTGVKPTVH